MREAAKALMYMRNWAVARDELGKPPTALEYAAYWKVSERTAWRDRAAFSKAFPDEQDPGRLLALAAAQRDPVGRNAFELANFRLT